MKMVLLNDLSLCIVDNESFRDYTNYCNPNVPTMSARTFGRRVDTTYENEKKKLIAQLKVSLFPGISIIPEPTIIYVHRFVSLQDAPGKVSIVLDCWTSSNQKPFIGIICFWISKDWELIYKLFDVVPLDGPHTGENLCGVVLELMKEFNIHAKLLACTTDNASNFDTFFLHLEDGLKKMVSTSFIHYYSDFLRYIFLYLDRV